MADLPNFHLNFTTILGMKPHSTDNGERWRQLCERASREHDTHKLLELTREINRLLDEKRTRGMSEGYQPAATKPADLEERRTGSD